jgi:hypothetical protein
MTQEDILHTILEKNREIERLQLGINIAVLANRAKVKEDPNFEDDYTENIESYYVNY